MKKTILITALAATGLAILPVYAEDSSKAPVAQQEVSTQVAAYVVQASGKG